MFLGVLVRTFMLRGVSTSAYIALMFSIPSFVDSFLIPFPIRMGYFLNAFFIIFVILLPILSAVSDPSF